MRAQRCLVLHCGLFIRTLFTHLVDSITMDCSQPRLEPLHVYRERILPSSLPHRLLWRSGLYHVGVDRALRMETLALSSSTDMMKISGPSHMRTTSFLFACVHMRVSGSRRPAGIIWCRPQSPGFFVYI